MPLTHTEHIIKSTFHNDYESVRCLIENDSFNEQLIQDIGLLDVPCPLYYITMCQKVIMGSSFRSERMPFVISQRKNIEQLLDLWHNRFGIDVHQVINYKKYEKYFRCSSDTETEDHILMEPVNDLINNGCRKIDIQLYVAADKFHFSEVEHLLKDGANPDAKLLSKGTPSDDYLCCAERINCERNFLCTDQIFPMFDAHNELWYTNRPIYDEDIGNLIGLAAHETMYKLLQQYEDNN